MPDVHKAAQLVRDGAITRVSDARTYTVRSQSDPSLLYKVMLSDEVAPTCTCPATRVCKHIMGCWLLEEMQRREQAEDAPVSTAVQVTDCSGVEITGNSFGLESP